MKSRQFLTCRPNLLICVNLHPRFVRKIILRPGAECCLSSVISPTHAGFGRTNIEGIARDLGKYRIDYVRTGQIEVRSGAAPLRSQFSEATRETVK